MDIQLLKLFCKLVYATVRLIGNTIVMYVISYIKAMVVFSCVHSFWVIMFENAFDLKLCVHWALILALLDVVRVHCEILGNWGFKNGKDKKENQP